MKKQHQRAIDSFVMAAKNHTLSPRHVKRLLQYKRHKPDVSQIEQFLSDNDVWVRKMSARVVGEMGDIKKLIDLAKEEEEVTVLHEVIDGLVKRPIDEVEELIDLLEHGDKGIKHVIINMFRLSGRADCLMGLLFDADDELVSRVKRWMEEQE